ncbi:hypothetical protein D3C79_837710 [compost metagenome]
MYSNNRYLVAIGPVFLVRLVVGLALEVVGIQPALVYLAVRLDIVGEDLDIQLDPLLGQLRFEEFQNLGVRHRHHSDLERFSLCSTERGSQQSQRKCNALHESFPWNRWRVNDERSRSVEPRMHHWANASPKAAECLKPWPEHADTTKVCFSAGCSSIMKWRSAVTV